MDIYKDKHSYICIERSFCGPAIPHMFAFYSQRFPEDPFANKNISSKEIIAEAINDKEGHSKVLQGVLDLMLKIYAAAMGNFIVQHMCVGGLYLVGGLTNSLIPKLKSYDFLAGFKGRHPEVASVIEMVPIAVCN